MNEFFGDLI